MNQVLWKIGLKLGVLVLVAIVIAIVRHRRESHAAHPAPAPIIAFNEVEMHADEPVEARFLRPPEQWSDVQTERTSTVAGETARYEVLRLLCEDIEREISAKSAAHAGMIRVNEGRMIVYAVERACIRVGNDGFLGMFSQSPGRYAHQAEHGLALLGLESVRAVFARAMAEYPGGRVPFDPDENERVMATMGAAVEERWRALSEEFFALTGDEQVEHAIFAFILAHRDLFFAAE